MRSYQTAAIYLRYDGDQIVDVEFFVSDDTYERGSDVNQAFVQQIGEPVGPDTPWRGWWLIRAGRPESWTASIVERQFQESSSDGDE